MTPVLEPSPPPPPSEAIKQAYVLRSVTELLAAKRSQYNPPTHTLNPPTTTTISLNG